MIENFLQRKLKAEQIPKKILIKTPNWLGDSVMSIPAVSGIKKIFPDAEIWIWTKKGLMDLWHFVPKIKGIIDSVPKKNDFNFGILLTNSFSSALKMYLAKIPKIRGYSINFRRFLLTQPVKVEIKCKKMHQEDYFLEIIKDLNTNISFENAKIIIPEKVKETAKKILIDNGWDGKSLLIGIHATASFGPAKRWLPERFTELIEKLISEYNAYILVVGSEDEKKEIDLIIDKVKRPERIINSAGKVKLEQLISLIGFCNLFIANDSGPMHIAGLIGVPLVAIFGSTDPKHTGPRGKECIILRQAIKCSPCFRRTCNKNLECMKLISVADVMAAAKILIGEAKE